MKTLLYRLEETARPVYVGAHLKTEFSEQRRPERRRFQEYLETGEGVPAI